MCGMAGIVYKNDKAGREEIKLLTDTLVHRGPDGEGFYFEKNLALGHRRLAIVDLSPAGNQPMEYKGKKGDYVIVFNGEIYNYLELKKELGDEGYIFNTHTDTEVILAAYDKWGIECLERFNGMWAFVIYDRKKDSLFGARDRFGVKPFYYVYNDRTFAFASEIKALVRLPYYKASINEDVLFDYLLLGLEEQDKSIFKDINELQPSFAFTLHLTDFSFRQWSYYRLRYRDVYERFDENRLEDYATEVKHLIYNAIRFRLRADVPVGSCLSGGLDSSTIVCVVNDIITRETVPQVGFKQKVFTASYQDREVDESGYAELVVKHTQTEWHRTYPNNEGLLNDLRDLIYYQEVPFGSTSIYAQYKVMEIARNSGVKVLLDGQGGDEIFTGYLGYYPVFFKEMFYNLDLAGVYKEFRNLNNSPASPTYVLSSVVKYVIGDLIPKSLASSLFYKTQNRAGYFNKDFLNKHRDRLASHIQQLPKTLNEQLHCYITGKSLKALLRYEDRNSMRFSIEARTPFADDINLIEYIFSLPSVYKIHEGWSKFILRESMKGILPDEIRLRRSKIGFGTPEKKWLISRREFFENLLTREKALLETYVDPKKILEEFRSGKIFRESFLMWRIINFALWHSTFIDARR